MTKSIKMWFGNPIYSTQIENHEELNKSVLENLNINPTEGAFAKTTDVGEDGKDNLHTDEKHQKLFDAIGSKIKEFLVDHHYDLTKFDVNITKAWATFSKKDQHIKSHKHTASHYSLVYYVKAENQGDIYFDADKKQSMYVPVNPNYFTNYSEINYASVKYPSVSGGLIIFPSHMLHYTESNQKDEPRISISADVLLTMKKGIKSEHCLPCPETWSKIC